LWCAEGSSVHRSKVDWWRRTLTAAIEDDEDVMSWFEDVLDLRKRVVKSTNLVWTGQSLGLWSLERSSSDFPPSFLLMKPPKKSSANKVASPSSKKMFQSESEEEDAVSDSYSYDPAIMPSSRANSCRHCGHQRQHGSVQIACTTWHLLFLCMKCQFSRMPLLSIRAS